MRIFLEDHVIDQKHCNARLFQHTCEQDGAHLCRPHSQPRYEHDEANLRWQHWRKLWWESTKCVVVKVKSSCDAFSSGNVLSKSGRRCVTSYLGPYVVPSTLPRRPKSFAAFVKKPLPPNTSSTYFSVIPFCAARLAVALSTFPRHVAGVFPACLGAGAGESGSRPPDDCFCRILWHC